MKNRLIKTALPFVAAAALAAFLSSCSKGETAPEPAETEAQTEQTTVAETTTAATKKTNKSSAAKTTEKKSAETTAKTTKAGKTTKTTKKTKKTTTTTFTVTAVDVPPISEDDPAELESFIDKTNNFFSENALSFLGAEKKEVLKGLTYNEDYMVTYGSDKDEEQTMNYVVDGEKRFFFTLEFKGGVLVKFDCGSQMNDFDTALSSVKSKGWIRDESKVEKGKRVYNVPGRNVTYSIFKIRDKDGSSYITQSYELVK